MRNKEAKCMWMKQDDRSFVREPITRQKEEVNLCTHCCCSWGGLRVSVKKWCVSFFRTHGSPPRDRCVQFIWFEMLWVNNLYLFYHLEKTVFGWQLCHRLKVATQRLLLLRQQQRRLKRSGPDLVHDFQARRLHHFWDSREQKSSNKYKPYFN